MERHTMDLAEALSKVGLNDNNFVGINREFIAEPHPRPTSAPPELWKITKEGLFAYPPGGYGTNTSSNAINDDIKDKDILAKLHLSQQYMQMVNGQNAFSHMDNPERQLPEYAHRNVQPSMLNRKCMTLTKSDGNDNFEAQSSLKEENSLYSGSMNMLLNSFLYAPSFTAERNNSKTTDTYIPIKSSSIANQENTSHSGSSTQYGSPNPNTPSNEKQSLQQNMNERRKWLGKHQYQAVSGHGEASTQPVRSANEGKWNNRGGHGQHSPRATTTKGGNGKSGGKGHSNNGNKAANSNRTNSKKHSPRNRIVPGICSPEDLVTNGCYAGHVYAIAKDQAAGRLLQRKMDELGSNQIQAVYDEVLEHVVELMTDPFANYLCQKLMEVCSVSQLNHIIDKVSGELVQISLNLHGTRAIQKMIDMLCSKEQIHKVVQALRKSVVTLVKDLNGNHVIQKCLSNFPPEQCNFIYDAIGGHCCDVATHRHGCCVLQRCIDAADSSQRAVLINEICQNSCALVQDPFGNYVVQYILKLKDLCIVGAVINKLVGHIVVLSKQKFSSNVVETCLTVGMQSQRKQIITELLKSDSETLKDLLLDSFGNYVIQRGLHVAQEPELSRLLGAIRPFVAELYLTAVGRKVIMKLVKKYPQLDATEETQQQHSESTVTASTTLSHRTNNSKNAATNLPATESHVEGESSSNLSTGIAVATNAANAGPTQTVDDPYRSVMVADVVQQPLVMSEQMSPLHYAAAAYGNGHAPYGNPYVSDFSMMFHRNDFQHIPSQGVYSPMAYPSTPEMQHMLNSPRIVSFHSPYNGATLFPSMSPLNLNPVYPVNTPSNGWASSY